MRVPETEDLSLVIMENLETTTENLKQMSKDIKQYPGRLLFEKPPEKIPTGKGD